MRFVKKMADRRELAIYAHFFFLFVHLSFGTYFSTRFGSLSLSRTLLFISFSFPLFLSLSLSIHSSLSPSLSLALILNGALALSLFSFYHSPNRSELWLSLWPSLSQIPLSSHSVRSNCTRRSVRALCTQQRGESTQPNEEQTEIERMREREREK